MTTTTTAPQSTGLIAARLNTSDRVEIDGQIKTVDFARVSNNCMIIEWTDSTTTVCSPLTTLTVWL